MKIKFLLSIFIFLIMIGCGLFYFKSTTSKNADSQISNTNAVENSAKEMSSNVQAEHAEAALQTTEDGESKWINQEIDAIKPLAKNLNTNVLKLSLTAYQNAKKRGVTNNPLITIIDYSKPSSERRLWVIDLEKHKVLFNTLVAHGKNSGVVNSSSFSNRNSSLKSSLGVFVTNETYTGKHGVSLKVKGLEHGINDNAYDRAIVFHGASYVSENIAKANGRIGRSWGCMAVSEDIIQPLIKTIKNKALVFSYYPDQKWLNSSSFLN